MLEEALSRASSEDKQVFLTFGAPGAAGATGSTTAWPSPRSPRSSTAISSSLKIDIDRMTGGKDVMKHFRPNESGGIPWFAILDAKGKKLATVRRP